MKVLHARCVGVDVHKDLVVACARLQSGAKVQREQRRFDTTTKGLLALLAWLDELQCTHVAMEATGVYWKPVWHVLEGHVELVLANAAHIRNVPGRKSDTNDAAWIANLLAHGLITASMIPPTPIQELRDLTRTRKQLVREAGQHIQRVQRVLEDANVKLSSVISDVLGVSGRRILEAIISGKDDPEELAALGSERLQCSPEQLREALRGRVTAHHRFLLRQHLDTIDHLQGTVAQFDAEIARRLEPFRSQYEQLMTIPGVRGTAAASLIAEIGVDMSCFPSAAHLVSWAGLCPRMDESAGKRHSTRLRKGAPWLKPVLVQCAWAATRKKSTYAKSQYLRLKARRGPMKAIVAVAASILVAAYHILRDSVPYRDLGPDHFVKRDRSRLAQRFAQRIRELGYEVTIQQAA
ncbi:MAG TPA: IS110 family transposase [Planctomycetota bacterium]|nr:IS110 family transposase [Planctomycetota bacterium]